MLVVNILTSSTQCLMWSFHMANMRGFIGLTVHQKGLLCRSLYSYIDVLTPLPVVRNLFDAGFSAEIGVQTYITPGRVYTASGRRTKKASDRCRRFYQIVGLYFTYSNRCDVSINKFISRK